MDKSGPEQLLLKQYEFLRAEIIQCINLRQVAIIGMFTALLAAVATLLGSDKLLADSAITGALPFVALAVGLVANSFGSLYVHEQARNRRACSLNRAIEYLLTCLAWKTAGRSQGFVLWENYIADTPAGDSNELFYRTRAMGIGLPLLLFTIPTVVIAQVGFAPYAELVRADVRLSVAAASVAMALLLAFVRILSARHEPTGSEGANAKREPAGAKVHSRPAYSRPLKAVLTVVYVSPAAFLLVETAFSEGALVGRAVLADALAVALGCWAACTFFHVSSWLATAETSPTTVLKWLAKEGEFIKQVCTESETTPAEQEEDDFRVALERAVAAWGNDPAK